MKTFFHIVTLIGLTSWTSKGLASDIVSSVRDGRKPISESYKTFELGIGLGYLDNAYIRTQDTYNNWVAELNLAGEFKYKRFFFEAAQGTQDGLNLGYSVWSNDRWALDFLAASISGTIGDINIDDIDGDDEAARNDRTLMA